MDPITAFGIGALVFVIIVLLTAFSLKSASVLTSSANKGYTTGTQEYVDDLTNDVVGDVNNQDTPETVSEDSC